MERAVGEDGKYWALADKYLGFGFEPQNFGLFGVKNNIYRNGFEEIQKYSKEKKNWYVDDWYIVPEMSLDISFTTRTRLVEKMSKTDEIRCGVS